MARRLIKRIKDEIQASLDRNVTLIQKNIRRYLVLKWYARKATEIYNYRKKYCIEHELELPKAPVLRVVGRSDEEGDAVGKNTESDLDGPPAGETSAESKKTDSIEDEENAARFISSIFEKVSDYIDTYGKDPEYGLKRNRRITERLFKKILKMRFARVLSRFGVVYVDSYPPRKSEEELLLEMQQAAGGADGQNSKSLAELTDRDDFVQVFLPTFDPVAVRRNKAVELFHKYNHIAVVHLPTSVFMRKSVDYNISTIQCFVRQRKAKQEYQKMLRVHRAISLFQKIFRRRYERLHKAAIHVTSLFRMINAKARVKHLLKEKRAAITIQNSYRCYRARSLLFEFRSVNELSVLKSSPESVDNHGPERVLEHRADTFWIAKSTEKCDIRVEFARLENIVEVWIMTSTYSASPTSCSISVLVNKQDGYDELFDGVELPLYKTERWHKFTLSTVIIAKYFMVSFFGNYGDPDHIAVRQIRFIQSRESKS